MFSKPKIRRALRLLALTAGVAVLSLQPAGAQLAPKIGVFDAQRVSEETAEGIAVQQRLNTFRDAKQAELAAMESELADLQNQLNTQALSLSADKRANLEREIQRKLLDLNQKREAATREMQLEVAEAQEGFQNKLLAVIQQFGQEEGFDIILEASLVAYAKPSSDVTTALIDRFNAAFKPEPAAAGGGN